MLMFVDSMPIPFSTDLFLSSVTFMATSLLLTAFCLKRLMLCMKLQSNVLHSLTMSLTSFPAAFSYRSSLAAFFVASLRLSLKKFSLGSAVSLNSLIMHTQKLSHFCSE